MSYTFTVKKKNNDTTLNIFMQLKIEDIFFLFIDKFRQFYNHVAGLKIKQLCNSAIIYNILTHNFFIYLSGLKEGKLFFLLQIFPEFLLFSYSTFSKLYTS